LEFVVAAEPDECQVQLTVQLSHRPTDPEILEMPGETAEIELARRHLVGSGARFRNGINGDSLPTLTVGWPLADISSVTSRKETKVS